MQDFADTRTGMSPSGKAQDFDSCISWVRIPPAQPKTETQFCGFLFFYLNQMDFSIFPLRMAQYALCLPFHHNQKAGKHKGKPEDQHETIF